MIRKATINDLEALDQIYDAARQFMIAHNNPNQWNDGHPNHEDLEMDIQKNQLYVIEIHQTIQASFVLFEHEDPTYEYIEGSWLNNHEYVVIHKVATRNEIKGMGTQILEYAKAKQKDVRIDTHQDNIPMQNLLKKNGFQQTGTIYLQNGSPRIAFQYVNKQD